MFLTPFLIKCESFHQNHVFPVQSIMISIFTSDKGKFGNLGAPQSKPIFFMTVLSATLLLPWAKTIVIEKWTSNLVIDGRRVRYTGSGAGLFGVWLKIWALSVITLTVYYWISGRKAVANYIDSHIQWA